MADRRPTRGQGPRGSRRPASSRGARRPGAATVPAPKRPRSRFTGRATILFVVVAVLTVSYASSLRAWLEQRDHIADLQRQISQSEKEISALEREKRRWKDDAYVEQQARERFGFVMPGEKAYRVLDEDGKPLDIDTPLGTPVEPEPETPEAWWEVAWDSVLLAGDPPTPEEVEESTPADKLKAP